MSFWKEFTSPITACGRLVLETSSDAHISKIPRDVPKDYRRARRTTPKADTRRTQEARGRATRATNIRFTSSYDWNHCAIETGWQPPSRHTGLYESTLRSRETRRLGWFLQAHGRNRNPDAR